MIYSREFLLRAVVGAAVFGAVQWWLFAHPPASTGLPVPDPGWFLNSFNGALAVMGAFFLCGALTAWLRPADVAGTAAPLTAGGAAAMTATYAWLGFGNIFPIVLTLGAGTIGVPAFAGAWVISLLKRRS